MNKGTGDDANQAAKPAGKDSKIIKINTISNLVYKYKPDEKQKNGWRYQAQNEPFVFNVGFFGQMNRYSVFGDQYSVIGIRWSVFGGLYPISASGSVTGITDYRLLTTDY